MIKIGITGGIGSGKTTVCKLFEKFNIPIFYADDEAKKIIIQNKKCKYQIINAFGEESYFKDGTLNRKYLADYIFSDNKKVILLNAIIHPLVDLSFNNWLDKHKACSIIMKEAALLFETGLHKKLDKIIVVDASEEIRIERVLARDKHRNKEQIKNIIDKQMPQSEKNKLGDFLILNSGEDLEGQVLKIFKQLKIES